MTNNIQMWSEVVEVSPELAKQYLRKSRINPRFGDSKEKFNKYVVEKYASDMKSGNFCLTSDSITFDTNGELANGHHRLQAVIQSGCTVKFYVTHNAPVGAIYDNNYKRTPTQIMRFTFGDDNELSSTLAISTTKLQFYFEENKNRKRVESKTIIEIHDYIQAHKDALEKALSISKCVFLIFQKGRNEHKGTKIQKVYTPSA